MSICVNCYHRIKHSNVIEVGQLWNNEPYLAVVCSDKCKEEIEKKVTDGTWMVMRSFPKTEDDGCQKQLQTNSLEQNENL
mgnify:CR=1 FL=1